MPSTITPDAVQQYLDGLRDGDLAAVGDALAADVTWHQPGAGELSGSRQGRDDVFGLFGAFMERSGGSLSIVPRRVMRNGPLVAVSLDFSATRGGRSMAMEGVDLFRLDPDGKIAEVWLFSGDQAAEDAFWAG